MGRMAGWGWGLVPLALLWGAGTLFTQPAVRHDVAARAIAAAHMAARDVPGARPIAVAVDGRDVRLSGEALTADGVTGAAARVAATFGIRRVESDLTQVVAQKPYGWSAERNAGGITLGGFVPDEAVARAAVAAARELIPGAAVVDEQRIAFGAPDGFVALVAAQLPALAQLQQGKIAIDDQRFCIEGTAASPDSYLALTAQPAHDLPPGFAQVDCGLRPPSVSPYRWGAEKSEDGALTLTGFHPSQAAREALAKLTRERFPQAVLTDATKPARGEPDGFEALARRALTDLARLRSGRAEIGEGGYVLDGKGPEDFASCEALRIQIAQLDGPGSVARTEIACPPPPPAPAEPSAQAAPSLPLAPVESAVQAPSPSSPVPAEPAVLPAPVAPAVGQAAPLADAAAAGALPETVAAAVPATEPPGSEAGKPPEVALVIEPAPLPPPPSRLVPLSWRLERDAKRVVLDGLAPSEAERSSTAAALREAFPAAELSEHLRIEIDLRNQPDYAQATRFALSLASHLSQGMAAIAGERLTISGFVPTPEAFAVVQAALSARPLPGGLAAAEASELTVRPYDFAATVGEEGVVLSGLLPDESSRAAIIEQFAAGQRGPVKDETRIVPGAPDGFASAARAVAGDLSRLERGAAQMRDETVAVKGQSCRDLIRSEVVTNLATALPGGFKAEADVATREEGCGKPADTCQAELDAVTKRHAILFEQGTTVLGADAATAAALDEIADILRQCPKARIAVEGHANSDGEMRGFDNRGLSARRAARVEEALVARGVSAEHLASRGFGVERPLLPHGTAEAKMRNRRVQFTLEH